MLFRSRTKKFYMADLSTFEIGQLVYSAKFSTELGRKSGMSPCLLIGLDSVDSMRLVAHLYGELAKYMRFIILGEPFERSLYLFDQRGEPVCDLAAARAVTG